MWLLDVNLPNALINFLREEGIQCETTVSQGWRDLGNGVLSQAAFSAGFRVILTRDKLFGESAGRALKQFPELSVVIVKISQAKESIYMENFKIAWKENSIHPKAGEIIEWSKK